MATASADNDTSPVRWATQTTVIRPGGRTLSRRAAVSRARTAGGDPSNPTTRWTSRTVGVSVLMSGKNSLVLESLLPLVFLLMFLLIFRT